LDEEVIGDRLARIQTKRLPRRLEGNLVVAEVAQRAVRQAESQTAERISLPGQLRLNSGFVQSPHEDQVVGVIGSGLVGVGRDQRGVVRCKGQRPCLKVTDQRPCLDGTGQTELLTCRPDPPETPERQGIVGGDFQGLPEEALGDLQILRGQAAQVVVAPEGQLMGLGVHLARRGETCRHLASQLQADLVRDGPYDLTLERDHVARC
jgi:hypothetical protein